MKKLQIYFILLFIIGCGPELQTVINRDQYNRIVLKAELKGEADTLWTHIYSYHDIMKDSVNSDSDLSVDSSGDLTWGEEPEIIEDSNNLNATETKKDSTLIPVNIDTTKKSFSSFIKNKADGEWKEWYLNGTIKSTSFHKKGRLEGLYSYYDSLGVLNKTATYSKGSITGFVREYLNGSTLISEKTIKKDSLDGEWSIWHPNGQINVIKNFKNGSPVGNWIFNNNKGQWAREEQYKKGLAHGIWSFYDSVNVKVFQYYTKGELMAEYNEAKWPNGQIKEVPAFKNGLPHGTWTGYWPDGSTMYSLNYKNGKKHGSSTKYDSLGILIFEVKFDKGLKNSLEKNYFSNGKPKRVAKYKDGKLNGKTELFNIKGIRLETLAYKDSLKNGNHTYWWPNGEKNKVFTYDSNILNGEYEEWDSLGTNIVKGFYSDGKQNKKWLYFDNEGHRVKITFIKMDSIITDYIFEYYTNWQVKEEPKFNDEGEFDGNFKSFYEGGEVLETYAFNSGLKKDVWLSFYVDERRNVYKFYKLDTLVTDYTFKYYNNLQIKEEPKFNDKGEFDGIFKSFYEGGETLETYAFNEGLKQDVWLSYYIDKRRDVYKFYNSDTLITDYTFKYYNNLQIQEEPSFNKNGLYNDKWEKFFLNGMTSKTSYYLDAELSGLSTVIWDSTYNKQSESIYLNDSLNGNYFEWYVDGKQKEEGNYKSNKKDLLWTYWNKFGERRFEEWRDGVLFDSFEYEYYPNGQVKEEPSYENGKKHGDWVRYFQDGTVRGTSAYKNGMKDGLWVDYFRPEQIAFQGKYEKNIKVGKWEWFWLNRSLMSKVTYDNGTITFEECYNRSDGSIRDCSKVFSPDDIYFKNE
jgi:antitoxin component YwqK of YwqJK toxin-antitoxin module